MKDEKKQQQQVRDGGHATFSVKVTQAVYDLVNILAEGLAHGTNGNDLLKMFIHAFIEAAKHEGPVSPEIHQFLTMLTIDPAWHKAFNFADVTARMDIAQCILILQQRDADGQPRNGFGMVMIDKPFCGEARQTYCVDDIMECVAEVGMKGLYKQLVRIGVMMESNSLRETLVRMCDAQSILELDDIDRHELPGYGDRHDFGRAIEYGQKNRRVRHRTPDSLANSQLPIQWTDDDRAQTDYEAKDWEGEHRQTNPDNPLGDIQPFDVEP